MGQTNPTGGNQPNGQNQRTGRGRTWVALRVFIWVAGCAVYLVAITWGLWCLGRFIGPSVDRVSFVTGNLLTAILAALVAVQAYVYIKQWDAMDIGIRESIKTREFENRPWVSAEKAELIKPLELPPASRFSVFLNITFTNSGNSVAVDGLAYTWALPNSSEILLRDWDKPSEITDRQRKVIEGKGQRNQWPIGFVLVPGQSALMGVGVSSDEISLDQARRGQFFVLGCATYRDHFGIMHRTRFAFRPVGQIDDPATVKFEICNGFQSAD